MRSPTGSISEHSKKGQQQQQQQLKRPPTGQMVRRAPGPLLGPFPRPFSQGSIPFDHRAGGLGLVPVRCDGCELPGPRLRRHRGHHWSQLVPNTNKCLRSAAGCSMRTRRTPAKLRCDALRGVRPCNLDARLDEFGVDTPMLPTHCAPGGVARVAAQASMAVLSGGAWSRSARPLRRASG